MAELRGSGLLSVQARSAALARPVPGLPQDLGVEGNVPSQSREPGCAVPAALTSRFGYSVTSAFLWGVTVRHPGPALLSGPALVWDPCFELWREAGCAPALSGEGSLF